MINVKIDGQPTTTDLSGVRTMGELIELVQATMDPDCIITSVTLNENDLSEEDWRTPLAAHGDGIFLFTTGSREAYLQDRLEQAPQFVSHILTEFTAVADHFGKGAPEDGNKVLSVAVDDLKAFMEWYDSLLLVSPVAGEERRQQFLGHIGDLKDTCENLVQQQLYNSWWAMTLTIRNELVPKLEALRQFVDGFDDAPDAE